MSLLQASEIKVRKFVYQGGNLFSGYLIPLYRSTILTKTMGKQEFMIDILDHRPSGAPLISVSRIALKQKTLKQKNKPH